MAEWHTEVAFKHFLQERKVPGSIPIGASSAAACSLAREQRARELTSKLGTVAGPGEGFKDTQKPGVTILSDVLESHFLMPLGHLCTTPPLC